MRQLELYIQNNWGLADHFNFIYDSESRPWNVRWIYTVSYGRYSIILEKKDDIGYKNIE
jgi:hypothetical protein